MLRHIAFVWDSVNAEQSDSVRILARPLHDGAGWRCAVQLDGLLVFYAKSRGAIDLAYLFPNREGVVLGKLFSRSRTGVAEAPDATSLDESEALRIQTTLGRHLVDQYWGRYVAFFRQPHANAAIVLRDPTGIARCLETKIRGVHTFFSHASDCVSLGFKPAVNLDYVAAYLQTKYAPECRETGLSNVTTTLGGECVQVKPDGVTRSFHWDPRTIAAAASIEDLATATHELRHAVRGCTHAWASCYESVLHKLSGGLDSSILLACLADAPTRPAVTCLNLHSPGADGDERRFARLAARRAAVTLVERERDPAIKLAPLLDMPLSVNPCPSSWMYHVLFGRAVTAMAREHGASVVFSGEYGDQIFYQGPATLATMDYARNRGLNAGLARTALDVARLAGISIWQALGKGIWHGFVARHSGVEWSRRLSENRPLPFELLRNSAPNPPEVRFVHPWLEDTRGIPIGKFEHMSQVVFNTFTLDNSALSEIELVSPLYSQPLIEVSLQIPIYLHLKGGWDRSIARRAFSDAIPREITLRRTKGGREEHAKETLYRNIKFVRELLLDGVLVREGILDGQKLECVLSGESSGPRSTMTDVYWSIGVEAWIRGWSRAAIKIAA